MTEFVHVLYMCACVRQFWQFEPAQWIFNRGANNASSFNTLTIIEQMDGIRWKSLAFEETRNSKPLWIETFIDEGGDLK